MSKHSQEAIITGRVQGVGYRAYCKRCAQSLTIAGYCENMPDGSVRVGAYGEAHLLKTFWTLLRQGPPLSRVENMNITNLHSIGEPVEFDILH